MRFIRTLSLLIFLVSTPATLFAQAPDSVTYSGYLETTDGTPVSGTIDVSFALFSEASDGSQVWAQDTKTVNVDQGHFRASLTDLAQSLESDGLWLEVSVGGEPMTPRTRLDSVPYALNAANAQTVGGLTPDQLVANSSELSALETRVAALEESASVLDETLDAFQTTLDMLVEKTAPIRLQTVEGLTTVLFSGVNIQLISGAATGTTNGLGNLIIGDNFASSSETYDRSGSENLIIGDNHNYSSIGGLVTGAGNTISGNGAVVLGGDQSSALGDRSVVIGGRRNSADGLVSTVTGGLANSAGDFGSVLGGRLNETTGDYAAVCGGESNLAAGTAASVTGGVENEAAGLASSVSGGRTNSADGDYSSIGGGLNRSATDIYDWAAGTLLEDN